MIFGMLRRQYCIGLDIQPDAIHFVRVIKGRELLVEEAESINLPEEVGVGDRDRYWRQVAAAVTELASRYSFKGVPAFISLPAEAVNMQTMMLPSLLAPLEMKAEIMLGLQREAADSEEPMVMDFSVLSENEGQSSVFITAIREAYMAKYLACVASAGLQVKIIDVDVSAMQRAVIQWLPQVTAKGGITALLCVKNNSMVCCLFDSQKVIFHQRWAGIPAIEGIKKIKIEKNRISQFILCGFIDRVDLLMQEIACEWGCECIDFNPFDKVKVGSQLDRQMLNVQRGELMASLGVVLREMPLW